MNTTLLASVAQQLVHPEKGILAADESTGTIKKRFDTINVESTEENRRAYRELLFTSSGFSHYISGVILYDETIRQSAKNGRTFVQILKDENVIPGIKVDMGTAPFKNSDTEKTTQGFDGLTDRLKEYYEMGAGFAKWRAVYTITDSLPSTELVEQNAKDLARYAKLCQEANIVPVVEPEVLMDGAHTIERCLEVTTQVLQAVFAALKAEGVYLPGMLLKPNMVISGSGAREQASAHKIAELTLKCFHETVPAEVPGIVFLSGGQSEKQACETLEAINEQAKDAPWQLSYSYGRALQGSTLTEWGGKPENIAKAQKAFLAQAKAVSLARQGKYTGT